MKLITKLKANLRATYQAFQVRLGELVLTYNAFITRVLFL